MDYVDAFIERCTGLEAAVLAVVTARGIETTPPSQSATTPDRLTISITELAADLGVDVDEIRGLVLDMQAHRGQKRELIGIESTGPQGRRQRVYLAAEIADRILPARVRNGE